MKITIDINDKQLQKEVEDFIRKKTLSSIRQSCNEIRDNFFNRINFDYERIIEEHLEKKFKELDMDNKIKHTLKKEVNSSIQHLGRR